MGGSERGIDVAVHSLVLLASIEIDPLRSCS